MLFHGTPCHDTGHRSSKNTWGGGLKRLLKIDSLWFESSGVTFRTWFPLTRTPIAHHLETSDMGACCFKSRREHNDEDSKLSVAEGHKQEDEDDEDASDSSPPMYARTDGCDIPSMIEIHGPGMRNHVFVCTMDQVPALVCQHFPSTVISGVRCWMNGALLTRFSIGGTYTWDYCCNVLRSDQVANNCGSVACMRLCVEVICFIKN